jgi:predicted trehalose synthase
MDNIGYGYGLDIRRIRIGYHTDININMNILRILNKNIVCIIGKIA